MRFCLIAKLWESRNDKKELPLAWSEIATRAEEASGPEKIPLGKVADRTGQYLFKVFPWEYQRKSFDDWLGSTDFTTLRKEAVCLVNSELNNQVMDKAIYWERGWEVTGEKFRLAIELDSLWSAIWEFFAWDTSGISWRRCPHCQKFFYPKRRDQFYCTPQQQALASKRAYAAWSRAEEQKKKKSRRGLMKRRATK